MKMKNILLTIAVIIISYVLGHSQTPTVFNSILENTMNIADQKIENQQLSQKFVSIKNREDISTLICGSPNEIVVIREDSIFIHNFDKNSFTFITERIPGISGSVDVIQRDNQYNLVTTVDWDSIYYFINNEWVYSGYFLKSKSDLIHVGCGKNSTFLMGGHLYYFSGNSQPKLIRKNIHYTVADLAVDERDNAWVITGTTWPIADTLRIIDSTGFSLCDIPFETPTETLHGFGMIIHDGKPMLGFGSTGHKYSNSMVYLIIDTIKNVVKFDDPFPISPYLSLDLGSCSKIIRQPNCKSETTGESNLKRNEFSIFPMPFNEYLNITSTEGNIELIKVIDLTGRIIIEQSCQSNIFKLNTEILKSGLYFIKILSKDRIYQNFTAIKN
ncbi:MAG: T9SS type A sorting domain-containing protein [Saprospiraceae bacterium]|nr:T9SS type A sorting domain-containing protein [Saprospiraceae bacterium]